MASAGTLELPIIIVIFQGEWLPVEKYSERIDPGIVIPELYSLPAEELARELLGYSIYRNTPDGLVSGMIVETEAYLSYNDPACHAARGLTRRNATMFGSPGKAYVYFIYGNYFCLNVVSGPEGSGEAVLIRAVEPLSGLDLMRQRRAGKIDSNLVNGPGKLCQAFAIDGFLDGHDLRFRPLYIAAHKENFERRKIVSTPRIGVSSAKDKKLRFIISGSQYLSRRENIV